MSRKPNDMTARKPSTKQAGKKKPTTVKRKSKRKPDTGGEETPIIISGGSIIIESELEREETDVKKHKKCKIKDVDPGKKWKPVRVEIHDDTLPTRVFSIVGEGAYVRVIFQRPS